MALTREQMAMRVAEELRDGYYVNLGIGMPTLVANYIPEGMDVFLQSENVLLGIGPFPFEGAEDPDLINAGSQTITEVPAASFFASADSSARVRRLGFCRLAGGLANVPRPRPCWKREGYRPRLPTRALPNPSTTN